DEPVAALDPLARRHFLGTLTAAMADSGGELTVVLSSHLIADLERVCDHIILLTESRVQLCGDIDTLLSEHKVLVGPRKDTPALERTHTVVHAVRTARQATMLVRLGGPVFDPAYEASDVDLEELVLGYMGASAAPALAHLTAVGEEQRPGSSGVSTPGRGRVPPLCSPPFPPRPSPPRAREAARGPPPAPP